MGRNVIACYEPKAGMKDQLVKPARRHVQRLRAEDLVADLDPVAMEAQDGTFVEIFGWKSKEAIEAAHSNARVQQMWQEYAKVCEYVPIAEVPEAKELFSEFAAVHPSRRLLGRVERSTRPVLIR